MCREGGGAWFPPLGSSHPPCPRHPDSTSGPRHIHAQDFDAPGASSGCAGPVAEECLCLHLFNDTATTEIYSLTLHDALPIFSFREKADGV